MNCPIAKEGRGYVGAALAAGLGLIITGGRTARNIGFGLLGVSGALLWFFRDPERFILEFPEGLLSPADGKVIRIDTVTLPEYFKDEVRRVSIFMNIFDCHINRAPISGTVTAKEKAEGTFLAAWEDLAAEENRRCTTRIDGEQECVIRQIAGLIARQIVTYPEKGDKVTQGEKIGMIKFGSRVDVFFPLEYKVLVNIGDKTEAGITPIAVMENTD